MTLLNNLVPICRLWHHNLVSSSCSVWFLKYDFSAKIWFMKTTTRIVKYESRVLKRNPIFKQKTGTLFWKKKHKQWFWSRVESEWFDIRKKLVIVTVFKKIEDLWLSFSSNSYCFVNNLRIQDEQAK